MNEPESLRRDRPRGGAEARHLIFVVNCNWSTGRPGGRNGKISRSSRASSRAGWNVIKLLLSSYWDPLLGRDKTAAEG